MKTALSYETLNKYWQKNRTFPRKYTNRNITQLKQIIPYTSLTHQILKPALRRLVNNKRMCRRAQQVPKQQNIWF